MPIIIPPSTAQCFVSGNLWTLSGGAIPQGTIVFELSNIGIGNPTGVIGTCLFPNLKYTVQSAGNGSFTTYLWGNDVINPANTIYNVTYRDSLGNEIGPIQYAITGTAFNLNAAIPINNISPPILYNIAASINFQNPINLGGVVNGTNVTFTFPRSPGINYLITVGGAILTPGVDYTVSTLTVTFTSAPVLTPVAYSV
jgi:hypothetical protein